MPGLYGYFQRIQSAHSRAEEVLGRMLAPVRARHGTCVSSFADRHVALRNMRFREETFTAPPPLPLPSGVHVFLDGYILNRGEVIETLRRLGRPVEVEWGDEALVALLYGALGEAMLDCVRGVFNVCVYDAGQPRVRLLNCRHGARHLYYVLCAEYLAFATEIKALLAAGLSRRRINRLALCDMFNFAYISGTQSFFEDIRLLEGGTVLEVGPEREKRRKYWDYSYRNAGARAPLAELIEEAGALLERAVGRYHERFGRAGIPLSGGLDSRAILAFSALHRRQPEVFHCAWYAREERIARQLCRLSGGRWHGYDPLQFDMAAVIREGMEISAGAVHCHQFWFLPLARDIERRDLADVLLDGYLMDVFFGDTFLVLPRKRVYSAEEKRKIINGLWRRCRPIFVKKAFLPAFYREYEEANRASIEAGMASIEEDHLSNFIHRFSFANRSNRYSVALPNVQRQYVEYGYPGLDGELTDFYLRLPPEYKAGARFYRAVLQRCFPHFSAVPWAKTGRPLDRDKNWWNRLADKVPLRQLGAGVLLRLSGGRLDCSHRADLNRHFRRNGEFRRFFTGVLRDPRTHSRGLIDAGGVERLLGFVEHGWPVMSLIQSLVTVELWFRRFVDEE